MSIKNCISKAGHYLHEDDKQGLLDRVEELRALGMSADEAERNAVEAMMAELEHQMLPVDKRPAKIKAPDITRSAPRADIQATGFYSALSRGVDDMAMKGSLAGGWKTAIKGLVNKGAAKADEVEWTGINDWLDLQEGKVSKEQVQEYLKANGVQVQEVTLGVEPRITTLDEAKEYLRNRSGEDPDEHYGYSNPADYISTANFLRQEGDKSIPETKFSQYVVPGGENYREVLLTLPGKTPLRYVISKAKSGDYVITGGQNGNVHGNYGDDYMAASQELGRLEDHIKKSGATKTDYKSSHWEQPNVLAHVRLDDRTDADGNKVLFVQEIQSDWGQEGKKQGFGYKDKTPLTKDEDAELMGLFDLRGNRTAEQSTRMHALNERLNASQGKSGIPVAPFVTKTEGWLNLALKRVIKLAVDGGYDKVAFANGEQSAGHYDLSKQVDSMIVGKEDNGSYSIVAMRDGREVVKKDNVPAQDLDGLVGKEMAAKIIDGEGKDIGMGEREFSGLDLKVGGEGMKTFYDKIVPNTTNALLKKLGGGKIESMALGGGQWHVVDTSSKAVARFETEEDARQWVADTHGADEDGYNDDYGVINSEQGVITQPGFAITDAMRERAADGMPLFSVKRKSDLSELESDQEGGATKKKYRKYDGMKASVQVRIEDTGEVATLVMDVGHTLEDFDNRQDAMKKLIGCLT